MDTVVGIMRASFLLFAEMAPYLLIGIVAAGAIHVLLPEAWVARKLGGTGMVPSFRAAVLGIPLPLCSCGVVPVAASLKKSGASPGATVSFLVTTPTSGVDSILATYSLLGGLFAGARVIASFIIGLAAGIATTLTGGSNAATPVISSAAKQPFKAAGVSRPFKTGLAYGFGELFGGMAKSLALGTLLGGAITYFVPADAFGSGGAFGSYSDGGMLSYLVMMVVGIPLYVCATGSIPMAAAMLAKGISPGAALVFLIAGPATNAATMGVVFNMLGKRTLAIFLGFIALGAIGAGVGLDALLAGYPALTPPVFQPHHHEGTGLAEVLSGAFLGMLLLYHLMLPFVARARRSLKKGDTMATITVPDMTCQHCAGTITKAVSGLEGVKRVIADPSTKKVDVDVDDDAKLEGVVKAIADAGYSPELDRG